VAIGDEHAIAAAFDRALEWRIAMEEPAHHASAARVSEEFAVVADETARRRVEDQPGLGPARRAHFHKVGPTLPHLVDDDPAIGIVDVNHDFFDRLQALARFLVGAVEHAGAGDGEFEALAPHRFDQHAELEFAATRY